MCFFSKPTQLRSCQEKSLRSTGILCNADESCSDFHGEVNKTLTVEAKCGLSDIIVYSAGLVSTRVWLIRQDILI